MKIYNATKVCQLQFFTNAEKVQCTLQKINCRRLIERFFFFSFFVVGSGYDTPVAVQECRRRSYAVLKSCNLLNCRGVLLSSTFFTGSNPTRTYTPIQHLRPNEQKSSYDIKRWDWFFFLLVERNNFSSFVLYFCCVAMSNIRKWPLLSFSMNSVPLAV